jgi:hypothetical protein
MFISSTAMPAKKSTASRAFWYWRSASPRCSSASVAFSRSRS